MSPERPEKASAKKWLVALAALLSVVLTLKLGHWQLTRAWEKENLQSAIENQAKRLPLDNAGLLASADTVEKNPTAKLSANLHRPVKLRGSWASPQTVFLDNRQMDGKPGFYVVTPLQLQDSKLAVLVQRGWVQRNFQDRSQLPPVQTPAGVVEIEGRLAPAPAQLYDLGADVRGPIRQNIDLVSFGRETGLALLPFSVVQTVAERIGVREGTAGQDSLLRRWPQAASGAGKNYGYAFQWFALSALITSLYVWFQFGKRYVSQRKS